MIALAGTLGPGARRNHDAGIDADAGSWPPGTTAEAVDQAATLLTDATERALRLVLVGAALSRC